MKTVSIHSPLRGETEERAYLTDVLRSWIRMSKLIRPEDYRRLIRGMYNPECGQRIADEKLDAMLRADVKDLERLLSAVEAG